MPMGIGLGIGVTRGGGVGWWPAGSELALEFDNGRGFNSIDRTKTTPDSILTYTNPSAKMVYGSDGVLRYAPHNLYVYSGEFTNAGWTKTNASVSSSGSDYLVTASAVTGFPGRLNQAPAVLTGFTYTVFVVAKKGTHNFIQFYINNQAADFANFDLNAGIVGTKGASSTSSITSIGDGYYLCEFSYTAGGTDRHPFVYMAPSASATRAQSWTSAGTETVYLRHSQFNLGSSALTYIPTTTAAVYSLPIDHNPTTFEPLGVLIEEERKNLLLRSQEFNDAAWVKARASITANATTAPDGTTTADKLVEDTTAANNHNVGQGYASWASGSAYTKTIYAKASERSRFLMQLPNAAFPASAEATFDVSAGTVASTGAGATSATIEDVGGGWYRCRVTAIADATTSGSVVIYLDNGSSASYDGDGSSGLFLWGAQLEAGAFPTSYIPTTNNPLGVTRLADQVSILTSAFGYNAAAGAMVAAADSPGISGAANIITVDDGTANERIRLLTDVLDPKIIVTDGGVPQANIDTGAIVALQPFTMSVAYALNDIAACLNGGTVGTDSVATIPTVTTLRFGSDSVGNHLNGHIKRFTYFPTRRSNADLQVLTT